MAKLKIFNAFKEHMNNCLAGIEEDNIGIEISKDHVILRDPGNEHKEVCRVTKDEFEQELIDLDKEEKMIMTWKAMLLAGFTKVSEAMKEEKICKN